MSNSIDIVEYTEKILGIELLEYQKEMLRAFSKLPPNARIVMGLNGRIYIIGDKEKKER